MSQTRDTNYVFNDDFFKQINIFMFVISNLETSNDLAKRNNGSSNTN